MKTVFFACLLLVKLHNSFQSRSNFDLSVTDRHTDTQTDRRTSSNLRLTYTKGPSGNNIVDTPETLPASLSIAHKLLTCTGQLPFPTVREFMLSEYEFHDFFDFVVVFERL